MSITYPTAIDAFGTITGSGKKMSEDVAGRNHPEHHDDLGLAIVAVETAIGLPASPAAGSVCDRLDAMEAKTPGDAIVHISEDYLGIITNSSLYTVNTSNSTYVVGTDPGGHPGIVEMRSGTADAASYVYSYSGKTFKTGSGAIAHQAIFAPIELGSSGADYDLYIGLMDRANLAPTYGSYFHYKYDVNGGKLQCITNDGSNTTITDSGYTLQAGTYVKVEIVANADASSVSFKVNGTTVATHTTTIYAGSGNQGAGVTMLKSTGYGTTSRKVALDQQQTTITLTTPR